MNIAELSIRYKTFVMSAVVALLAAGYLAYMSIGRLEDPEFTIKEALIVTLYPGASAQEVAEEVTDAIETAVQQLPQLKMVTSVSEPGRSTVTVEMQDHYTGEHLPQIWDELRRKVSDAGRSLPPGAMMPVVFDDFGDVYGVFYAVYGDGYDYAELLDHADMLRRELLLVNGVGKIALFGEQDEVVYVEFSRERMANLGIAPEVLFATLQGQNLVTPAGRVRAGGFHVRLDPTGAFGSVEDIENLLVLLADGSGTRLYLRDVATVTRGYMDPPSPFMRFNGQQAVGVAISTVQGGNVVHMGEGITARLHELKAQTPIGIEIGVIAHQAVSVEEAVNGFVMSLIEAIVIVVGTLVLVMGVRSGLIIGAVLLLTVMGTVLAMKLTGVLIERVSLGAMVIALALMVDNTIVVVEGMQVAIQRGVDRIKAASSVVAQTAMPLLGATVIAVLAFAAIGLSQDRTGEYTRSLYEVMLYSLMISWVLAITVTPVFCNWFLAGPKEGAKDPFAGRVYQGYRRFLALCIRYRLATGVILILLMVIGVAAFGRVERIFFPPSTRAQFMVHYWLPQGTHIQTTGADAEAIAAYIKGLEGVTDVTTLIGAGPPRFLLTFSPEERNTAYAMVLISVDDQHKIGPLMKTIVPTVRDKHPDAHVMSRRFALGPSQLHPMEVRLRGPDPGVLFELGSRVRAEMEADWDIVDILDDWREREMVVRPVVHEMRARDAGLTRRDIALSMRFSTDGDRVGVYREGDLLLPIIARPPDRERLGVSDLIDSQIWSPVAGQRIPMRQVVGEFQTVSEHTMLRRRDRLPTLTIGASAASGNANGAVERLRPRLAELELPTGYTLEWGGDDENSRTAQAALASSIPAMLTLIVLTLILLFNGLRQTLIVMLTVPLAIIGVALGLLFANQPFGFMAVLGFLSLAGMLIKNSIVLIDELDLRFKGDGDRYETVLEASMSRLRPVTVAAFTTVLGMIPLLPDQFFAAMAVAIMAGLSFATVLTMIVVPVLYAAMFGVKAPGGGRGAG